jgi:hypothetical protein
VVAPQLRQALSVAISILQCYRWNCFYSSWRPPPQAFATMD